jgi:hypothetical protein
VVERWIMRENVEHVPNIASNNTNQRDPKYPIEFFRCVVILGWGMAAIAHRLNIYPKSVL